MLYRVYFGIFYVILYHFLITHLYFLLFFTLFLFCYLRILGSHTQSQQDASSATGSPATASVTAGDGAAAEAAAPDDSDAPSSAAATAVAARAVACSGGGVGECPDCREGLAKLWCLLTLFVARLRELAPVLYLVPTAMQQQQQQQQQRRWMTAPSAGALAGATTHALLALAALLQALDLDGLSRLYQLPPLPLPPTGLPAAPAAATAPGALLPPPTLLPPAAAALPYAALRPAPAAALALVRLRRSLPVSYALFELARYAADLGAYARLRLNGKFYSLFMCKYLIYIHLYDYILLTSHMRDISPLLLFSLSRHAGRTTASARLPCLSAPPRCGWPWPPLRARPRSWL